MEFSPETSLLLNKLGAIFVLLVVGAFSCWLPYLSKALTQNRRLIDICSCFGGGTFLALGMFHLMPEATEAMKDAGWTIQLKEGGEFLPLAEAIAFFGFALILLVERVIFSDDEMEMFHSHDHGHGHGGDSHGHDHSHGHSHNEGENGKPFGALETPKDAQAPLTADHNAQYPSVEGEATQRRSDGSPRAVDADDVKEQISPSFKLSRVISGSQRGTSSFVAQARGSGGVAPVGDTEAPPAVEEAPHDIQFEGNPMTAYMMMVALSLHNVFEGTIIGTGADSQDVWMTTVIILAHHWVAGVALTMGFIKQNVKGFYATVSLAMFCVSGPVGALFGLFISSWGAGPTGAFNALATGTILYVATCEVISAEFALGRNRKSKFAAFLVGAAAVFGLTMLHQAYGGHGHSHGEHGHSHEDHGHSHQAEYDPHPHHAVAEDHGHDHGHAEEQVGDSLSNTAALAVMRRLVELHRRQIANF